MYEIDVISLTALVSPHMQFPGKKNSDINILPVSLAELEKAYAKKEKKNLSVFCQIHLSIGTNEKKPLQ